MCRSAALLQLIRPACSSMLLQGPVESDSVGDLLSLRASLLHCMFAAAQPGGGDLPGNLASWTSGRGRLGPVRDPAAVPAARWSGHWATSAPATGALLYELKVRSSCRLRMSHTLAVPSSEPAPACSELAHDQSWHTRQCTHWHAVALEWHTCTCPSAHVGN
jgi:hypothetical protein